MKPGYYLIKHEDNVLPARFDGEKFHHEKGITHENECVKDVNDNPIIIPLACPAGCSCSTNSDGSIHVDCTPK